MCSFGLPGLCSLPGVQLRRRTATAAVCLPCLVETALRKSALAYTFLFPVPQPTWSAATLCHRRSCPPPLLVTSAMSITNHCAAYLECNYAHAQAVGMPSIEAFYDFTFLDQSEVRLWLTAVCWWCCLCCCS